MKQNIISYLSTIEDTIFSISKFLYDNPEKSFNEYKSSKYITDILSNFNFNIEKNFLNIDTAFSATYGNGHPKICFICKYTADEINGHIYGNNVNAAITVASALALKEIIDKTNGTIVLLGCPGLYSNGSEVTITHENFFSDIDIILAPHIDINNAQSGSSMACIPLKIEYTLKGKDNNSLDYALFNLSSINKIVNSSCNKCYIDNLNIDINNHIHGNKIKEYIKFNIKSTKISEAAIIDKNIRKYLNSLEEILDIEYNISFENIPCKELISNDILSRIFSNNLKENGIINICEPKIMEYPLSIGTASHTTPTIYPSISITEDNNINCPSIEFRDLTLSSFCKDITLKSAAALASTAIDFIERADLLNEITVNFYESLNKKNY